jgi:hypothetical protein
MADTRDRWEAIVLADTSLGDAARVTAWALRHYADREGRTTVSVGRIVRDTGRDRRTVQRHLSLLAAHGYISRRLGQGTVGAGGNTALTMLVVSPASGSPAATPGGSAAAPSSGQLAVIAAQGSGSALPHEPINHIEPGGAARVLDARRTPPEERKDPLRGRDPGESVQAYRDRVNAALPHFRPAGPRHGA